MGAPPAGQGLAWPETLLIPVPYLAAARTNGRYKLAMALMSYLIRDKLGTYYFRRVIPPTLTPFMSSPWTGKREWKRSLRTEDPKEARLRGARLLGDCMADFEAAVRAQRGESVPRLPSLGRGALLCLGHPLPPPRQRLRALRQCAGRPSRRRLRLPHAQKGLAVIGDGVTATQPGSRAVSEASSRRALRFRAGFSIRCQDKAAGPITRTALASAWTSGCAPGTSPSTTCWIG